ncbi:hypothetical protein V7S43_004095 [Phytophthora oleae]|uniref:Uncharacterized protein n=1 Tax=Phytophthora oleae TaxID=2107226 RepID=A0ABD3FZ19_9STRA
MESTQVPRKRRCLPSPERKPKRMLHYYERQKHEMDALTQELCELSKVLILEARKKAAREAKKESKLPSVWETVARHRLQSRLAVEARMEWLQKAVKGNATLIEDLRGVVRYRMTISGIIAAQLSTSCPRLFPNPSDDVLYVTDMLDIGDMYQQSRSSVIVD